MARICGASYSAVRARARHLTAHSDILCSQSTDHLADLPVEYASSDPHQIAPGKKPVCVLVGSVLHATRHAKTLHEKHLILRQSDVQQLAVRRIDHCTALQHPQNHFLPQIVLQHVPPSCKQENLAPIAWQ